MAEAATGAAVEAATGAEAKVTAATGAEAKVTAAAVCCGSVRGATEIAVVNGAWAECSGRSGAGARRRRRPQGRQWKRPQGR